MDIVRIFEDKETFWCPCYEEDNTEDIFTVLLNKWTDTEYLIDFFKNNIKDLQDPYWRGISIDEAVDLVLDEVYYLQEKLICIAYKNEPDCADVSMDKIFRPFKKHNYVINVEHDNFVKGKLNSLPQMLRIYGIQLEDGNIILSGGAIKICSGMNREHLKKERERIEELYDFLKHKGINNIDDLKAIEK